ncbi:MAG: hypothetical protein EBW15_09665 [Actinobacteria bacterium]|nr:hypothetical protein [Actinomycetota bacterium]
MLSTEQIAYLHLLIRGQPAVTFKGAGEIVDSKRDGNGDWNIGPDGTNQRFLDMTALLGRYFKECLR